MSLTINSELRDPDGVVIWSANYVAPTPAIMFPEMIDAAYHAAASRIKRHFNMSPSAEKMMTDQSLRAVWCDNDQPYPGHKRLKRSGEYCGGVPEPQATHPFKPYDPNWPLQGRCFTCGLTVTDGPHMISPSPEPYTPQVGDRITSLTLTTGGSIVVTAVGETMFLGRIYDCRDFKPDGTEMTWSFDGWCKAPWEKIPDPVVYPEVWIIVLPPIGSQAANSFVFPYNNRPIVTSKALGVIHLASDGTLTMEAP